MNHTQKKSTMRDFSSCFGKHSTKLTAASTAAPTGNSTTVTSIFRARLSSGKPLITKLTWTMNQADPSLSIVVDDSPDFSDPWKTTSTNSLLLNKKKGTFSFLTISSSVSLHWDFSAAGYQQGPEPIQNFYFSIVVDGEIALLLGDQRRELLKRINGNLPIAEFSLLCRREEVAGRSLNSTTRAKFGEAGKDHEISIRCREAELLVSIDKKRVVHVVKLNWNFRGNETIFVDGLAVDMMWDMHGWWFGSLAGHGHAVFLFRQRRKLESRLWLEEKEALGFSFLIQAFRSTS